jgi:threonine dehydratase
MNCAGYGTGRQEETPITTEPAAKSLPVSLDEIRAAQRRLAGSIVRTPLVRLNVEDAPAAIYLKLENLQPIGSFKLRGAGNAMALAPPDLLAAGVYTASAGNMAQGVAWNARRLGIRCSVVVPDHAPEAKLSAIQRLGGEVIKVPFDRWWQTLGDRSYPGMDGLFIHPFDDPAVMAGNGTIGLEILEDLPGVDAVVIPYGGGGLSTGVASSIRALKPDTRLYAAEVSTGAPLAASFAAGEPQEVVYTPSFVDGIGGKGVFAAMWPRVSALLDGALVSDLEDIAAAVRLLVERNRVVAEGAGAAPVAAALSGRAGTGKIACIVSGGNIDAGKLAKLLLGEALK